MISVQNRLPEPGKENRVSITPDNGSAVEGVLAYADDATQEGTFWNRKTAQLLQGDIRTYPVRAGQSISAGDVVNVGKEVISGTTYGDLLVGSTVQINENGSPVDYIVVHQGNPDPNLYDASCNGTWMLRKDIAENRVWDAGNVNAYADSDINDYLNGGWLGRYDSTTLGNIKQVKIPYCVGNGSSTINSGANGLSVKAFFLGGSEVGWSSEDNQYFSADGAKLDFFMASDGQSANQKRIAALNGLASTYALRSPISDANGRILSVLSDGFCNGIMCQYSLGIRPCIIFDSAALLGDDIVYGPDTIYKDVVPQDNVENIMHTNAGNATGTSATKLNDLISVVSYKQGNIIRLMSFDNNTGTVKQGRYADVSINNLLGYSVDRLDDSRLVVQYFGSTPYDEIYAKICTYNGGNISAGNQYTVLSSQPTSQTILGLSGALALSIYSSSGLKCKALPISGTTITTSGTVYSLPNNTGANYISACRLPDEGGNKRVCICFADTGDGNKGKAVIATIDSSNAVTFGDVVTFEENRVYEVSSCSDSDDIIVAYNINSAKKSMVLLVSENTITKSQSTTVSSMTGQSAFPNIIKVGNKLVYIQRTAGVCVLSRQGASLTPNSFFSFGTNQQYISAASVSDNQFVVAYAAANNSSYGTTTILEVNGNQIAGSFLDNSSDAIALADGTGGQSIPVGFGGYCECPGVTEGETIDSSGVSAYAVQDGWLDIRPEYNGGYVTGSFSGTTSLKNIYLGFKPKLVILYSSSNNSDPSVGIGTGTGSKESTPRILTSEYKNTSFGCITDTGFSFNGGQAKTMYYIAWR